MNEELAAGMLMVAVEKLKNGILLMQSLLHKLNAPDSSQGAVH
jgi:hypothetical protein